MQIGRVLNGGIRRRACAAGLVLAVLTTACTGDGGDEGSTDDTGTTAETTADTAAQTAADAVVLGFGNPAEGWHPGAGGSNGLLRTVYENLVTGDYETEDLADVAPQLATEWEMTDEDITFVLREGVVFHDGTPFNAEAVAANVEYAQNNPDRFTNVYDPVESVEVVDDNTVRFDLAIPSPAILADLTGNGGILVSPQALQDGTVNDMPIGTGPWAFTEDGSIPDQRWRFERFDDYWGELPEGAMEAVEFVRMPDVQSRLSAVQTGEIHIADLNPVEAADAEEAGMEVLKYPAIASSFVFFDRGPGGVFEDIETRRAVCHAIDMEQLEEGSDGYVSEKSQRFPAEPWMNPEIESWEYRPEEAEAYFAEHDISAVIPAIEGASTVPEIYAGMLSEVGADFTAQAIVESDYHGVWNTGEFAVGHGGESEVHPYTWYSGHFAADGPFNPSGVESPELAAAAQAAIEAGTEPEAEELWQEALLLMHEEVAMCPYYDMNQYLVSNPDAVTNVRPVPFLPGSVLPREVQVVR